MRSSSEDHSFSLVDEMHIGAAGAETFWRFRQLMLHGYKPKYEHSTEDAFWFEHPPNSFGHRSVALYSTGVVRSIFAREETVFERWDKHGFADFLRKCAVSKLGAVTRNETKDLCGHLRCGLVQLAVSGHSDGQRHV